MMPEQLAKLALLLANNRVNSKEFISAALCLMSEGLTPVDVEDLTMGDLFLYTPNGGDDFDVCILVTSSWGNVNVLSLTDNLQSISIHRHTKVTPLVAKHKERKLITIGELGARRAYLDVPLEEAKHRYNESEGTHPDESKTTIKEYKIKDEFWTYEVSEP